ncbi:YfhD family protein [Paenisporosarcina antarctica]|uniref:Uncharacterized protein n=1 Tax=Paenisporosarcina antarctica TaxID=417367 RepID=A0A4P6ZX39_9BACL|nr:YfhD family protein [Paenisporosarcina antarctica]QBP41001.1 hypothetical protein E2636_07635 [Paenisporosarcina antarctica]
MGRDDNKSTSNSKNTLPQTPKSLKIPSSSVNEELASEFAEIGSKALKVLNTSTHQKIVPDRIRAELASEFAEIGTRSLKGKNTSIQYTTKKE